MRLSVFHWSLAQARCAWLFGWGCSHQFSPAICPSSVSSRSILSSHSGSLFSALNSSATHRSHTLWRRSAARFPGTPAQQSPRYYGWRRSLQASSERKSASFQRTAHMLCALRCDFIWSFPFRSTRQVGLSLSLGRWPAPGWVRCVWLSPSPGRARRCHTPCRRRPTRLCPERDGESGALVVHTYRRVQDNHSLMTSALRLLAELHLERADGTTACRSHASTFGAGSSNDSTTHPRWPPPHDVETPRACSPTSTSG